MTQWLQQGQYPLYNGDLTPDHVKFSTKLRYYTQVERDPIKNESGNKVRGAFMDPWEQRVEFSVSGDSSKTERGFTVLTHVWTTNTHSVHLTVRPKSNKSLTLGTVLLRERDERSNSSGVIRQTWTPKPHRSGPRPPNHRSVRKETGVGTPLTSEHKLADPESSKWPHP